MSGNVGKKNLVQKLSTQTKDGLKIENQRLSKILSDLKRKYKTTYEVIQVLDQEYERSKDNPVTRYAHMKQMILDATTDDILRQSEPPKIPKHKGVKDLFHSTEGTTEVRAPVKSKPSSFLQVCKEFAGKSDESSYAMKTVTRNLSEMHKAEIEDDNRHKEHLISVYENKFLRAHNRLIKLKQEYLDCKEDLPPIRYKKLKEMIKVVTKDATLKPE